MKTTDGREMSDNANYFDADGREVAFQEGIVLESGECKYLVNYCYEADGMDVRCYGNGPVEYNFTMDIEGHPVIINKIFAEPPTPKKNKEFIEAIEEENRLKASVGTLQRKKEGLIKEEQEAREHRDKVLKELSILTEPLVTLTETKSSLEADCKGLESDLLTLSIRKNALSKDDKEMLRLLKRDEKLSYLEAGGVDNWDAYDDALENYEG